MRGESYFLPQKLNVISVTALRTSHQAMCASTVVVWLRNFPIERCQLHQCAMRTFIERNETKVHYGQVNSVHLVYRLI